MHSTPAAASTGRSALPVAFDTAPLPHPTPPRPLACEAIGLREITADDLPTLNRWRNDPELIAWLTNQFRYIGPQVDQQWFAHYQQNRDRAVRLAIVAQPNAQFVGTVQVTQVDARNQQAEFSILLGEKRYWSRGIGKLATRGILRHAFRDLNLHRLYLHVLPDNHRAIRLYETVGFRHEGVQRQALFKDGAFRDLLSMSILRDEFRDEEPAAPLNLS